MPIQHNGSEYYTMSEAAKAMGVSRASLKRYLADGKLPEPPRIRQGTQQIRIFDADYIKAAREAIERSFQ